MFLTPSSLPKVPRAGKLTCKGHRYVGLALPCLSVGTGNGTNYWHPLTWNSVLCWCTLLQKDFLKFSLRQNITLFPLSILILDATHANFITNYLFLFFFKSTCSFSLFQQLPAPVLFCSWTLAPRTNEVCTGLNFLFSFKGRLSH